MSAALLALLLLAPPARAGAKPAPIRHANGQIAWLGTDGASVRYANGQLAWLGGAGDSVRHANGRIAYLGGAGDRLRGADGTSGSACTSSLPVDSEGRADPGPLQLVCASSKSDGTPNETMDLGDGLRLQVGGEGVRLLVYGTALTLSPR